MNIKTLLTLSLLVASFNAQSAVTACPSGWTKSADGLTCVFEEKKTETPKQSSNNAKPVCISGFAYSSTSMKCEQNTIASQFTANKAYAYMGGLKFGSNPQEADKCLNFTGTQTVQPANSYQSGGGNCACNSGFQYNGLSDNNANCNYVPVYNVVCDCKSGSIGEISNPTIRFIKFVIPENCIKVNDYTVNCTSNINNVLCGPGGYGHAVAGRFHCR